MNFITQRSIGRNVIAFIVPSLVIIGFYHEIILHPASYLYSVSSDGVKNYIVPLWMVLNSNSWTEYTGMNYPYSESIFYTAGELPLLWFSKLLGITVSLKPATVIGILNSAMIWSFPIAGFAYYKLIFTFTKKYWPSIVLGTSLMLLAPQIFRIQGHYSLTHPEALPIVWFLVTYAIYHQRKMLAVSILLLINLFYVFNHPYIGLMTSIFSGMVLAIYYLHKRAFFHSGLSLLLGILPPVIFQLVVKSLDHHLDRPTNVSGFFYYTAEPDDVFLPVYGPLNNWLIESVGLHQEWEAWSYIGLGSILVLLLYFPIKWLASYQTQLPLILKITFIPALIFLLWSFGMPFKLGWEEGLEFFPLLKQFRAIGRFTWPFFTVCTVWAAVVAIKWSAQFKMAKYVWVLLAFTYVIESVPYHQYFGQHLSDYENPFTEEEKRRIQTIIPGDYAAVIPLPYYLLGSETYDKNVEYGHVGASHELAFQLGLPSYGAQLVRLSIPESRKHMASFSAPFYQKDIWDDIPPEDRRKPFLILADKREKLTPEELNLLERATRITTIKGFDAYKIMPEDFLMRQSPNIISDSLPQPTFYRDYSQNPEAPSLSGIGAWSIPKEGGTFIYSFHDSLLKPHTAYEATVWLSTDNPRRINQAFYVAIKECNTDSSDCLLLDIRKAQESQTHYGPFVGVKLRFEYSGNPGHFIRLETYCRSGEDIMVHLDKVIVHEVGTPSYVRLNDSLILYQGSIIEN